MYASSYQHIFETKLRNKYGKFVKLQGWEAHKSGYPHAHILYYFLDHKFPVFRAKRKKKKGYAFRIPKIDRDFIEKNWEMGYTDIQGVREIKESVSEIKKYITKSYNNKKGELTTAMAWLFNKKQWYISKNFVEIIWKNEDINVKTEDLSPPKRSDLVLEYLRKCNNGDEKIVKWRVKGLVRFEDLLRINEKLAPDPVIEMPLSAEDRIILSIDRVWDL